MLPLFLMLSSILQQMLQGTGTVEKMGALARNGWKY